MIGKTLAHYEILSKLGAGGMGVVYRARDTQLERSIALKVLPAEPCAGREFVLRFQREVRSLAALTHPNIVTIHSFEEIDDVTFYTMEFVDGQSLASLIPKQGFSLDQIFGIAVPLADAVAHAHAQGITHRDLKPANIMLDQDGRPRVLDFGLAKVTDPGTTPDGETVPLSDLETGEGRILGTVAYMSPEQAEGKPANHRSDIFSLGIILYEMATGQRPFGGDTPVSTISSIIKDTPSSITNLQQQLPRHLWRIVKKCLEKDPGRRYQSTIDLRNDLEELKNEIDTGEMEALPITPGFRSSVGRWRWPALAVIVVAACLLGYGLLTRDRPAVESPPARLGDAIDLTRSGKVRSADLSPDGKLLAYVLREENQSSLNVLQLSTSIDAEIVPPQADVFTSVKFGPGGDLVYFLNEDRSALFRVTSLGGRPHRLFENVFEYALAPDGQRVAVLRYEGDRADVYIGDIPDGNLNLVRENVPTAFYHYLDWSSDGQTVVLNSLRETGVVEGLMTVSGDGECEPWREDLRWGHVDAVARLRDGSGMMIAAPRSVGAINIQQPSELWFIPAPVGDPVMLTRDPFDYKSIGSDAQGDRLIAVQRQSTHAVWVLAMEEPSEPRRVMYASRTGRWWLPLSWTPEHKIIFPALAGEAVHLWEVGSHGSELRRLTNTGNFNACVSLSPDGQTMAYCSDLLEGTLKIYLVDREGGAPRRLSTAEEDEFLPEYSPDGKWIAHNVFTAQRSFLRKTSVADGRSVELKTGLSFMPCFSPDGNQIACVAMDTLDFEFKITIADAEDGRILRTFPNLTANYARVRWTPDGDALIYNSHQDDVDNLWLQPLDGSEPRQLTNFTAGGIVGFAISAGGDSLAVATMESERDVVMFEDYRGQIERALGKVKRD